MEECVSTVDLSASDKHHLLVSRRRRLVLALLAERSDEVELENLAATLARREAGAETVDEETVDRVKLTLHHRHLPMMDDLGVVDYDADLCRVDADEIPHISAESQLEW